MKHITTSLIKNFLSLAGERLTGNWVLIGGCVLALKGRDYRVTNDIDIVGPKDATQTDTLILMEIAEQIGLPPEAINQAGALFLYRIADWKKHLVQIHEGKSATFYCPDKTLYLRLKIRRLSETDLEDCLQLLKLEGKSGLDVKVLERELKPILKNTSNMTRSQRAARLLGVVQRQ